MLRSFPGAVSHEAASLEAAFEVLGTQEIHCILVDHNIPPSTSEELLEAAHAASWGDTPVIVITGLLDDELRARLLLAGAQDFLTKDAAPLEVRRSIENAIWRQQSRLAVSRGAARMRRSLKLEAVGSLARGVAHEFNNILMVIQGVTELMIDELTEGEPQYEDAQEILTASKRGADLTRRLLAFARTEMVRPVRLDINGAIHETLKVLARILGESVSIELELAEQLPAAWADEGHVEQIILNLCLNASEAIDPGGAIIIRTSAVTIPDEPDAYRSDRVIPGEYLTLIVEDTGRGMDEATRERIFDPFFSTKADDQSAGMGLSTVYGMVKQNGGQIEATSRLGEGTTFKVLLPRARPIGEHVERAQTEAATVLLVEDEPAVRRVACRVLELAGYKVIQAASGAEALKLFREIGGQINILVTDNMMPGMTGEELMGRIRRERPAVPVVLMTGFSEPPTSGAYRAGGFAFLRKPFTSERLLQAVSDLL